MSNDIKLAAQGALARAASSSVAVSVAHACPDAGRACPEERRVFRVRTSLSGRGEAFAFSPASYPQLAAPNPAQKRRVMTPLSTLNCHFLTGSGSQTELGVTCSKQRTASFLTGSRIDQYRSPLVTEKWLASNSLSLSRVQEDLASARSSMPSCPTGASWPPAAAAMVRIAVWLLNWSVVKSAMRPELIAA
jgi:hypothetical protein